MVGAIFGCEQLVAAAHLYGTRLVGVNGGFKS